MAYIAVAPSMGYSFGDRNEKMGADRARETPAFICAKHKLMCEAQVPIFSTGIPPLEKRQTKKEISCTREVYRRA